MFLRITKITYIFIVFFMIITAACLVASDGKIPNAQKAAAGERSFDAAWRTPEGAAVANPAKLNLLPGSSTVTDSSIYAVIPDDISEGMSLCFRAKHIFFSVYIDGQCVYVQDLPENRFYTNSIGVSWVFIPLRAMDAGKIVELRYRVCYARSACGIDYLKIVSERGMLLDVIKEKASGFAMSIVYFTLAVILVLLDFMIAKKLDDTHEFMYLGLIALSVAVYCIVETQLFQFFIGNERIMHLLSCYSLMMLPLPLILYTNAIFPFKNKYIIPVFTGAFAVVFVSAVVLNFLDIADYHDTMTAIHISILTGGTIMFGTISRYIVRTARERKSIDIYLAFEIAGIVFLVAFGIVEMIRFYFAAAADPAKFLRIGLLGFILCYATAGAQRLIVTLKMSTQAELMTELAYHDALTGLANRAAYDKKMKEIEEQGMTAGICEFDINNLKKVNDTLGHEAGDLLIKDGSALINKAFAVNGGTSYRTGGDEFFSIITGRNVRERVEASMELLVKYCDEAKTTGGYPFEISMAMGSAVYDGSVDLKSVIRTADTNMYENKRKMKEKQK